MVIIIPGILLSIAFAYYFMQKDRIRREQRHERMKEKQQELLDRLIRSKIKKSPDDNNGPIEAGNMP